MNKKFLEYMPAFIKACTLLNLNVGYDDDEENCYYSIAYLYDLEDEDILTFFLYTVEQFENLKYVDYEGFIISSHCELFMECFGIN